MRMIAGQRGEEFEEVARVQLVALFRGARRLTRPRAETTQADGFFERYEVERVGRGGHVRPEELGSKGEAGCHELAAYVEPRVDRELSAAERAGGQGPPRDRLARPERVAQDPRARRLPRSQPAEAGHR